MPYYCSTVYQKLVLIQVRSCKVKAWQSIYYFTVPVTHSLIPLRCRLTSPSTTTLFQVVFQWGGKSPLCKTTFRNSTPQNQPWLLKKHKFDVGGCTLMKEVKTIRLLCSGDQGLRIRNQTTMPFFFARTELGNLNLTTWRDMLCASWFVVFSCCL